MWRKLHHSEFYAPKAVTYHEPKVLVHAPKAVTYLEPKVM